ncbi:PKD domain-containing protein [Gynuella sunshinyii]|uniref:Zinc metalloprotease (Elastase) n=1 Tax=Gynuella sunshinyii YC6258 TaxID=1445510 RepID=A0A0C5UZW0_9GAMM|nr:PKD domain-containing protein [Gynuella sunshinyii]AJQ92835.1 zinc metalloprotease (elastase) [Gynuella sunshinyii YC6258]
MFRNIRLLSGLLLGLGSVAAYSAEPVSVFDQLSSPSVSTFKRSSSQSVTADDGSALAKMLHRQLNLDDDAQLVEQGHSQAGEQHSFSYQLQYLGLPVFDYTIAVITTSSGHVVQGYGQLVRSLAADLGDVEVLTEEQMDLHAQAYIHQRYHDEPRFFDHKTVKQGVYIDPQGQAHDAIQLIFFTDLLQGISAPEKMRVYLNATTGSTLSEANILMHYQAAGSGPGGNEKVEQADYAFVAGDVSGQSVKDLRTFVVEKQNDACAMELSGKLKTFDAKHKTSNLPENVHRYDCGSDNAENRHTEALTNTAKSALNDAHYHGQVTIEMFERYLGQKPYFHEAVKQYVHYGNNYDQAFYDEGQVHYGDGEYLFYPLVALDVVAHEIAHGYTLGYGSGKPAKMMLNGEARAINEAFSDMAGEAAEYYLNGENDWRSNYDSYQGSGALRYFEDPTADGDSVGHVDDYYDALDSHYGSGIFNKAFYLLATNGGEAQPVAGDWNTQYAFMAFATANQNCWVASSTFQQAADCVVRWAPSVVQTAMQADGVKGPDGQVWSKNALKNQIRKAFASVGIQLDLENQQGVESRFEREIHFLTVSFSNQSRYENKVLAANDATWQWDFGDGQVSTTHSPTHTYAQTGHYNVRLTVTMNDGETDTVWLPVDVVEHYCSVSGTDPEQYYASSVMFNNTEFVTNGDAEISYRDYSDQAVMVPVGQQVFYALKMGQHSNTADYAKRVQIWLDKNRDGQFSIASEQMYAGSAVDELSGVLAFTGEPGQDYRVRIIVSFALFDRLPCDQIRSASIQDYTLRWDDAASSYINIQVEHRTNKVHFSNLTEDNRVTSWDWQFGDGGSSHEKSPTHDYWRSGSYQVTAIAKASDGSEVGRWDETIAFTTVTQPVIKFDANDQTVEFDASDSVMPEGTTIHWDFGDGTTDKDNKNKVSHDYVEDGLYDVTLTLTNEDNPSGATSQQQVSIGFNPNFYVQSIERQDDGRYRVVFRNNTVDPGDNHGKWLLRWDFGDGQVSEESEYDSLNQSIIHVYSKPSNNPYSVTLSIKYLSADTSAWVSKSVTVELTIDNDSPDTGDPDGYCEPIFDAESEWIKRIIINGQAFDSDAEGGLVNPDIPIRLVAGEQVSYRIESGYIEGGPYAENYHVWIDLNGDGQFGDGHWKTDKSERVLKVYDHTNDDQGNGYVEGYFQVPTIKKDKPFTTRMRVLQLFGYSKIDTINPCSNYPASDANGEVEDYLVTISASFDNSIPDLKLHVEGLTLSFDTSASIYPEGAISKVTFGDGDSSTEDKGKHVYKKSGDYLVTLRIYDESDNEINAIGKTVTAENKESASGSHGGIEWLVLLPLLLLKRKNLFKF